MRPSALPALLLLACLPAEAEMSSSTTAPGRVRQMAPPSRGDVLMESGGGRRVAHDARPPVEETRARRRALVELLRPMLRSGRPGAFYMKGAVEDNTHEFRQDSGFYYLAGLETPFATMVIFFDHESIVERLYLPEVEDRWERYVGDLLEPGSVDGETGLPDVERAGAITFSGFRGAGAGDAAAVQESSRVREDLEAWLGRKGTLFLPALDTTDGKPDLEPGSVPWTIRRHRKRTEFLSASFALRRLRLVKSADEIARIQRATEITCKGHRAALRATGPGVPEYLVEGALEAAFIEEGARNPAFPSIVGSGPNSAVLHYYRNGRTMEAGDLVVIDIGAEYARYASDVTRTLPVSGEFSRGQREIYGWVLEAQRAGMALARPGSSIAEIDKRVREVLRSYGMEEAFWHGCCHFVGLDVHDVGTRETELKPGMVLTVEPGIYLPDRGLGVRIEDTLLITEEGHEILSSCAPSEAAEIEAAMAGRTVSPGAPASPRR